MHRALWGVLVAGCAVPQADPGVDDSDRSEDTTPTETAADTDLAGPLPAAPCGDDLDAVTVTVTPDLGDVPDGGAFEGDPGGDGPFQVVTETASLPNAVAGRQPIAVTVYLPSADGEVPAEGPFPLALVLPGFGAKHPGYAHFSRPLASWGFVVLGLDPANRGFADPAAHDLNAAETLQGLDWLLSTEPYASRIDATKVAALGHSQGGKIAAYAAALDPRIDLVVGWDPQNGGGPPCAIAELTGGDCNLFPVAPNCEAEAAGLLHQLRAEVLVLAAEDGLLTPDEHLRAVQFYRGAPSPAHLVRMPTVSHAAWTTDGEASGLTRQVHTALLLARLKGVSGLEDWLPGGAVPTSSSLVTDQRSK